MSTTKTKTVPGTILDIFLNISRKYNRKTAFVYRSGGREHAVSYQRLLEDVAALSMAFRDRDVGKGSKVILLSDNRYEWFVTDLALMALGAVSVPRGADTPSQELEFIAGHCSAEFLIAENGKLLEYHRKLFGRLSWIRGIFLIDDSATGTPGNEALPYRESLGNRDAALKALESFAAMAGRIRPDEAFTIIYTSGTTGNPKGVVLNHANIIHQIENIPGIIALAEEDRWLSILPSWHIFERTVEYVAMAAGSTIVYSTLKTFASDLEKYSPTLVATVPRLWESLFAKVNASLMKQSPARARIFHLLINISASFRKNARIIRNRLPLFEKKNLIDRSLKKIWAFIKAALLLLPYLAARKKLAPVRDKFGGRLRLAISGGGSLPEYLDEWIDAVGIRIVNAYGMTECSPGIAGRGLNCDVFGTLGYPVPGTTIRITDEAGQVVPAGVEGEIQVKGPQVTTGYYDNPEENEKSFTPDGFFKTGDMGKLALGGELLLTGRSKDIIVLVSGENVDPSRIEGAITELPFVKDAVLVGQDRKGLGALIIPDVEKLKEFLSSKLNHIIHETEDFLQNKQIVDKVKAEINKLLHPKKGFKPFEKLHNVHLMDREFKLGEELTNTLKKKRHYIEQKYKEIINRLFNQ